MKSTGRYLVLIALVAISCVVVAMLLRVKSEVSHTVRRQQAVEERKARFDALMKERREERLTLARMRAKMNEELKKMVDAARAEMGAKATDEEIKKHLNESLCLNLRDGGNMGVLSEESKKEISEKTKKAMADPETYKKYRDAQKKWFEEHKEERKEWSRKNAEKTEKKKANSRIRKLLSWPDRILKSLRNFRLTVKKICDKIKQTKNMLDSESFREAKTFLVGECKKIFLHIRPGKIKGEIRFGCEDPALTGQILAVAGICYPLYGKSFSLYPYFDRKILEGKVEFRGRIRGALFAGVAWRTFRNSHIKTLWKKIRH